MVKSKRTTEMTAVIVASSAPPLLGAPRQGIGGWGGSPAVTSSCQGCCSTGKQLPFPSSVVDLRIHPRNLLAKTAATSSLASFLHSFWLLSRRPMQSLAKHADT